jgi:hypothetical protein
MTRNTGKSDRIVRLVAAFVIFAIGLATGSWLGLIGFIPLVTGLLGTCPLYSLFGFSTCPLEDKS